MAFQCVNGSIESILYKPKETKKKKKTKQLQRKQCRENNVKEMQKEENFISHRKHQPNSLLLNVSQKTEYEE